MIEAPFSNRGNSRHTLTYNFELTRFTSLPTLYFPKAAAGSVCLWPETDVEEIQGFKNYLHIDGNRSLVSI